MPLRGQWFGDGVAYVHGLQTTCAGPVVGARIQLRCLKLFPVDARSSDWLRDAAFTVTAHTA